MGENIFQLYIKKIIYIYTQKIFLYNIYIHTLKILKQNKQLNKKADHETKKRMFKEELQMSNKYL